MSMPAPGALAPIKFRTAFLPRIFLGASRDLHLPTLIDFFLVERTRRVKLCSGRAVTMSLKVLYPSKDAGKAEAVKAE